MYVLLSAWWLQRTIHCPTVALSIQNVFILEYQVNNMFVDEIVTQATLGNDNLYRLFYIKI